jgi:hypothetical protein
MEQSWAIGGKGGLEAINLRMGNGYGFSKDLERSALLLCLIK